MIQYQNRGAVILEVWTRNMEELLNQLAKSI